MAPQADDSTAAVDQTVYRLAAADLVRLQAILVQLDETLDRPDASNPLEWDATGLPT